MVSNLIQTTKQNESTKQRILRQSKILINIYKTTMARLEIVLTEQLKNRLEKTAKENEMNMSELVRQAVLKYIKKLGREK